MSKQLDRELKAGSTADAKRVSQQKATLDQMAFAEVDHYSKAKKRSADFYASDTKARKEWSLGYERDVKTRKKLVGDLIAIDKAAAKSSTQYLRTSPFTDKRHIDGFNQHMQKVKEADAAARSAGRSFNLFGNALKGALAGFIVGFAIGTAYDLMTSFVGALKDATVASVKLAGDFQLTTNSMTVFAGTTQLAKTELAEIAQLSRSTPGLRLQDAEVGTTRLRALGFEAQTAKDLMVGLAKQKLLSGADEDAINRVIINITQLASGSHRATQDIKEMVLSMPTIRNAMIDSFGTLDKFIEKIRQDPKGTLAKFAKDLKDIEAPAAGFNDTLGKTHDAFIEAGRALGEPILDPLTRDLKDVTLYLRENMDSWRSWGQFIADTFRGVSNEWKAWIELRRSAQDNPIDRWFNGAAPGEHERESLGWFSSVSNFLGMGNPYTWLEESRVLGKNERIESFEKNLPLMLQNVQKRLDAGGFIRGNEDLLVSDSPEEKLQLALSIFDRLRIAAKGNAEQLIQINEYEQRSITAFNAAEAEKRRIQEERDFQERMKALVKGYQDQKGLMSTLNESRNASEQGALQYADRSTPGRAASVDSRSFALQLQDVNYRLTQASVAYLQMRGADPDFKSDAGRQIREEYLKIQIERDRLMAGRPGQVMQSVVQAINSVVSNPNVRAFLAAISEIEGGHRFSFVGAPAGQASPLVRQHDPRHPRQYLPKSQWFYNPRVNDYSTAAGSYQITGTTWADAEKTLGPLDFRNPDDQAKAALFDFWRKSGRDMSAFDDLLAGNLSPKVLKGARAWEALTLPGGRSRLERAFNKSLSAGGGKALTENLVGSEESLRALFAFAEDERMHQRASEFGFSESEISSLYQSYSDWSFRNGNMPLSQEEWMAQGRIDLGINDPDRFTYRYQPGEDLLGRADSLDKLKKLNDERDRQESFDEERNIAAEEYSENVRKQLKDLELQQYVLSSINKEEEVRLEWAKQVTEQTEQLNRVETELTVLRQQAGNEEFVANRRTLVVRQEELALRREIVSLEDDAANSGANDFLKTQIALLEQARDYREESLQAVIDTARAEVDINRMLEVRTDVIHGRVMRHLGEQKNMTDAISDGFIGMYEGAAGWLDGVIDRTYGKLGVVGDFIGGIAKVQTRSLLTGLTRDVMSSLGLGSVFDKFQDEKNPVLAGLEKQDRQISLLEQIAYNTGGGDASGGFFGGGSVPGLGMLVKSGLLKGVGLGPGGTPMWNPAASGGGSGGLLGGIFGGIGRLFGLGGGARGGVKLDGIDVGTGGFNPSSGSYSNPIGNIFGGGGKFSLGGLLGSVGTMLPGLGLSFGLGLGQGSISGSILGGLGGLAGGVAALGGLAWAGALAGTGLGAGSIASLAALGPYAAIAAPILLLGGWLLGRDKRRKEAERQRTILYNQAASELDKLISAVRGRRMDPGAALSQAENIRAQYTEQVATLKDSKTRRIAMQMWDKPNLLWQRMDTLNKLSESYYADEERDKRILPEFASGGFIRARRGGMLARLGEGGYDEVVLSSDPSKAGRTAQLLSGFLSNYAPVTQAITPSSQPQPLNLTIVVEQDSQGVWSASAESETGARVIAKVVNKGIRDREISV